MGESKFNPEKRVAQVIKNFPIPNTKSDLFEFIISLQSKINDGNEDYDFDMFKNLFYYLFKLKIDN